MGSKQWLGNQEAFSGDYHIWSRSISSRRLTPTECARLQGFPDWWCSGLGTEEPTEDDLAFWRRSLRPTGRLQGLPTKPKTDKQIIKWLKDPHSDSAEYKMWGNGVALPNVYFVLFGHCVLRTVPGLFIVTFFSHIPLALFLPFRVINVVPKTKEVQKK